MFSFEQNRALEALRQGKVAFGLQLRSRSSLIAELAGYLGFDYLYIETEHFACNDETIEQLVRAAQLSQITPWVRITDASAESIGHILDIGAQGIIAPHLETAEQARSLVEAVKFPPLGHRGSSMSSRAACFGCAESETYMKAANKSCSAIGMIESVKAVENLEGILDAGIDMIRVGQADLSLDMGLQNRKEPHFVETLRYIAGMARERNIPAGVNATDPEQAKYYQEMGFTCMNVASDLDFLRRNLKPLLDSMRAAAYE